MRKRFQITLGVVLGVLAGVSVTEGLRAREPVYQGKRLSAWLNAYKMQGQAGVETWQVGQEQQAADEALRRMGTKTVPTLLRMLRARDSALKMKFVAVAERQHVVKISYTPADELHYRAYWAFGVLRSKARCAAPALKEIARENISSDSKWYALAALASIGPVSETNR